MDPLTTLLSAQCEALRKQVAALRQEQLIARPFEEAARNDWQQVCEGLKRERDAAQRDAQQARDELERERENGKRAKVRADNLQQDLYGAVRERDALQARNTRIASDLAAAHVREKERARNAAEEELHACWAAIVKLGRDGCFTAATAAVPTLEFVELVDRMRVCVAQFLV